MSFLTKAACALALALAPATPSAHAAPAAGQVTVELAFAVFEGRLSGDLQGGASRTCTEIATSQPLFDCYVEFDLRTRICDVDLGEHAGLAQYTSPRPDFSIRDVPLYGAYAGGQGVLQSGPVIKIVGSTAYIFEITISAHDLCVEQSGVRQFGGKVTYL